MRKALSIGLGVALTLGVTSASAQQPDQPPQPPPPPQGTEPGTGAAGGGVGGGMGATGATNGGATVTPPQVSVAGPPPETKKEDTTTDHEKVVGKFGVGYLGLTQLPIGSGQPNGVTRATVDAPVIGVRYWLMEKLGIDGGIGFTFFNSSRDVDQNNQTTTTDGPAVFGLGIHGGLPLAFAYGKHYKFLLVPEVNVGFTSRTEKQPGNNPPPDIKRSGFRLDVGARVGTEIQFGFIGIPELALQASVGIGFRRLVWKNSQDAGANNNPPATASSDSENAIGTTVQADPWALFVNNISAIYYFP